MCKINKSLSPYPSRYPSPSQHVVIQVYKLPCDRCDGCDSLFSFYMRIAYYPRDCTNSITMLLKELQGCKVNSAIILLVGARFARPKIVYVAYYSQDRDRWFGQASPTTVKLRKTSTVKHILMPHQVLPTDICPTAILVPWRIWKGHRFHSCTK